MFFTNFVLVSLIAGSGGNREVVWDFADGDIQGWARSASTELGLTASISGGRLRGHVQASGTGHMESPGLELSAYDRQSVMLRMQYEGNGARRARWRARYGLSSIDNDDWDVRSIMNIENVTALEDGDASTYWNASDNATSVVFAFDDHLSHAVTGIEILAGPAGMTRDGREGGPPRAVRLERYDNDWILEASFDLKNTSSETQKCIVVKPVAAEYWRLVFVNGTFFGSEARVAEIRLSPIVTETAFGLSAGPVFRNYLVPLWRRAFKARRPGLDPLYLTRLRLELGEAVSETEFMRNVDASESQACIDWERNSSALNWASTRWRIAVSADASPGWLLSELHFFEDTACTRSLTEQVLFDDTMLYENEQWEDSSRAYVLSDGECPDDDDQNLLGLTSSWWSASSTPTQSNILWLGIEFKQPVAVRCVALCQSKRNHLKHALLQRYEDSEWLDHATLSLPASRAFAVANPCELRYAAADLAARQRQAYERSTGTSIQGSHGSALSGDSFAISWIKVAQPPIIHRHVTGCLDRFWINDVAEYVMRDASMLENGILRRWYAEKDSASSIITNASQAITSNCPLSGGVPIFVRGSYLLLNEAPPLITVGGQVCGDVQVVSSDEEDIISCVLPALSSGGFARIILTRQDGLSDSVSDLVSYMVAPASPVYAPRIFNLAARSVDLTWIPADLDAALVTTGYKVLVTNSEQEWTFSLGNVSLTTVVGLDPSTEYTFAVAAVAESRKDWGDALDTVDLYGRRRLQEGALISAWSPKSKTVLTLETDLEFNGFSALTTLSAMSISNEDAGPTGLRGGEGHYGLHVLGSANVQNCNASVACCDGFNLSAYEDGCAPTALVCLETTARIPGIEVAPDVFEPRYEAPRNDPLNGMAEEKRIYSNNTTRPAQRASAACGPSLRLTNSQPRQAGAVWYGRKLEVREGFVTSFMLRASEPSRRCDRMDDAFTHCQSRGADGFAFVIQEESPHALGVEGAGLGYEGINNSLAVEFDTYYNHELLEPYLNHISVHSRGFRLPNTAHHEASLASVAHNIPDLTSSIIKVRIVYDPVFDPAWLETDAFQVSTHAATFFSNADFPDGGMADFGIGIGTLALYIGEDLHGTPVLVTPINLDALLRLDRGRAYVGFTAGTGFATYQTHDLLSWSFTSLRHDPLFVPPPALPSAAYSSCSSSHTIYNATDETTETSNCVHG